MYEIDKDVPVPTNAVGGSPKYPWGTMERGDSFFVPNVPKGRLTAAVWAAQKKSGFRFTTRTVDGGIRVWRIA